MFSCAALAAAIALAVPAHSLAQTKAPAKKASAKGGAARTVTLEGTDTLKFQPATIRAKPGESLRVVLTVKGMMPKAAMAHNFVLLTLKADANAFVQAAVKARTTEYIPASNKADILAYTGLAGAGETVEVTFTAPKEPGTYTFICSFPAHFQGDMKGQLIVS
jgi:azurin